MHDPTNPARFKSLELALREALSRGRNHAEIEHVLLGLDDEQDDVPADRAADVAALAGACFAVPGALSDRELKDLIGRLGAREHAVSYERRLLHGTIDLLRAEHVARLRRRYRSHPSSR